MREILDTQMAERALAERMPEAYSSPQDMREIDVWPVGTVDICGDDGDIWYRVRCADGTVRRCPRPDAVTYADVADTEAFFRS
jgi:hypothetical protein